ncbi:MAG TPA: mannosyltransferase, partial [Candidatus Sulfopaludibacter sp.]|nr:mannosyltransferase [Candidatus Sulfopaludibacter sp.]
MENAIGANTAAQAAVRYARRKPHVTAVLLCACFAAAFLLRMGMARSPGIVYPDEIFQTLEPAHRLAFGYGVVTWEWRDGIRSWVFPAFLASIMRAADFVGCNYLTAIRATLSLLSLSVVWFAYAWAKRASGVAAAAVAAGAAATWYELAIFAPRAFSEVIATDFLLPGLYLGMYGDRLEEKKRMFLAGLCCGLAMSLRVQLAPAAAVAALYFLRSN